MKVIIIDEHKNKIPVELNTSLRNLTNRDRLKVLRRTRNIFLNMTSIKFTKFGLCLPFCFATMSLGIDTSGVLGHKVTQELNAQLVIPEYNREYFDINHSDVFWWELDEEGRRKRLKVLDTLIEIYKIRVKLEYNRRK